MHPQALWEALLYVDTKLAVGVHLMATREGSLRERVIAAWDEFAPAFLQAEQLPDPVGRELRRLYPRLAGAEGTEVTVRALSATGRSDVSPRPSATRTRSWRASYATSSARWP